MKLTAMKLKSLDKPGLHGDGNGLYLRITKAGTRQWVLRATVDGRRTDIGLGGYPATSLSKAREKATAVREGVAAGRDVVKDRRQERSIPTFSQAAKAVCEANLPTWSPTTAKRWKGLLERRANPAIGDMRVDRITKADVLNLILPLWSSRPAEARKLRMVIRTVLASVEARGLIPYNPAGDGINAALPRQVVEKHFAAMPHADVAGMLDRLEALEVHPTAKACIRLAALTACRSGEVRGAKWDEIEGDTWTIPAERMKTRREHRVPLSKAALATLEEARPFRDDSGLIFPSPAGREHAKSMPHRIFGMLEIPATLHGFRSSFRDWCAETGKPRELAEAALAHVVGGVEGAYFRSDLFERRRGLMEKWGKYITK